MVVLPLPAPPWMTTTPEWRRGHDFELARIDQRRDLGQVTIQALRLLRRGAEHATGARSLRDAWRVLLAARQLARLARSVRSQSPSPDARGARILVPDPDPLRAGHAQKRAILDGDRAALEMSPSTSRSPNVSS